MQTLATLNARYRNPHGVAMIYLLGWLAGCDGNIDDGEKEFLREFSGLLLNDRAAADAFLPLVLLAPTSDLLTACRQLKSSVDPSKGYLVFEVTLAMAMADGVFSVGENHIVRFLGDLLGVSRQQFITSFQAVTGRTPLEPGDVSSASWWNERDKRRYEKEAKARNAKAREAREKARRDQDQRQSAGGRSASPPPFSSPRRVESLKHLGLGPDATNEEIKAAYKRLAKVHHPDRFEGLSDEIVVAATLSFRRIREAYEFLIP